MILDQRSLIFAPMEGYTDAVFRKAVLTLFPEWDFVAADFFRLPTVATIKRKHLENHYGSSFLNDQKLKEKTIFQILTNLNSRIEENIKVIESCDLPWLDLNVGCPSKKVTTHGGGSYLLSRPKELQKIISLIRKNYSGFLSLKMRSGFHEDSYFEMILKMAENEGINSISIHPRLKTDLYKGSADWNYIKRAKELVSIPIIGNGDVLTTADMNSMFEQTDCHSIMIGRGAIANPLLAKEYKGDKEVFDPLSFLTHIKNQLDLDEKFILKRFKSLSVYFFKENKELLSSLLRSKSLSDYEMILGENFL